MKKPPKPRNPAARALQDGQFRPKVVEDKKKQADNPRRAKHKPRHVPTESHDGHEQ